METFAARNNDSRTAFDYPKRSKCNYVILSTILSWKQLQLFQRNVQIDEESPESVKSNLIEIYRKTVLPLSQRTKFQIQLPNLGGIQLNDESKK